MRGVTRRDVLKALAAGAATVGAACSTRAPRPSQARETTPRTPPIKTPAGEPSTKESAMSPVLASMPLGFQWQTRDPFLFCVHHDDRYPAGTDAFGPPPEMLQGRDIGMDFEMRDGWRMYHGDVVPGFPRHPHRGFETVTIVRRGLLDHSDSLGAAARYGRGDVQWLTAGRGIQHAEMFPLLERAEPNPVELFQIWMNLPSSHKMVDPHFSMLWSDTIPTRTLRDEAGKTTSVTVVAGNYTGTQAPSPPPKSWAATAANDVAIWAIKMEPGARWTLPAASAGANRTLYVFAGAGLRTSDEKLPSGRGYELQPEAEVAFENGSAETEMLLLQGRPIREPVARHGPFVMNTGDEIRKAYTDYRATQFGGWPWGEDDPVHAREDRFARHADGKLERPA